MTDADTTRGASADPAWTPRQREVLDLLAKGYTNSEIAQRLGISLDGAKWHMREILGKLGIDSREDAAAYWRQRQSVRGRARRALGRGLAVATAPAGIVAAATVVLVAFAVALVVVVLDRGSTAEAPAPPDALVAVAASLVQADCQPTPLYLVQTSSGEVRAGPTARYENLALSPSGSKVAVVYRATDCSTGQRRASLALIDTADLTVDERAPVSVSPSVIDWSPDERLVAIFGSDLLIRDLDADRDLVVVPLGKEPARWQIVWPAGGLYILVYADGRSLVAVPRGQSPEPAVWELGCPSGEAAVPEWLSYAGGDIVEVHYYCGHAERRVTAWVGQLDLTTGLVDAGRQTANPELPVGLFGITEDAWIKVSEDHPGAHGGNRYRLSSDRRLYLASFVHSPTVSVHERWMTGREFPADARVFIVVEPPGGRSVVVPAAFIPATLVWPVPLHDAVLVPGP